MSSTKLSDDASLEKVVERISRCGTIDLRVDYVRPGRGQEFIATATIIRSGNKVAVARMEMHNEDGMLIAFWHGHLYRRLILHLTLKRQALTTADTQTRQGVLFALAAYGIWGFRSHILQSGGFRAGT